MATYIKTLKEDNGDITYPQTKASAVLLNNNSDLETELTKYVTAEDIATTSALTPPVQTNMIADEAVTTAKISDEAVTGDKIDWESLNGSGTATSGGATWTWMYLPNGKKMYCTVFVFNIPSGTTSATAWRNSTNSLTLPDSLTFSTAVVSATMFYAGNGEARTTPLTSGTNTIKCGANNVYSSGAFTVNGHIIVVAK